jgi:hypothetical protein
MLFLQSHHIIDVYCVIDDILPPVQKSKGGRPPLLTESELATRVLFKWLNRRSQRKSFNWETFALYIRAHPLPKARICHALF